MSLIRAIRAGTLHRHERMLGHITGSLGFTIEGLKSLIKGCQHMNKKVDALEARVVALETQLAEVSRVAHSADAMWRPIGGDPLN